MWEASRVAGAEHAHVIPLDDLRPHAEKIDCWCRPTLDGDVLVHHALDRREEYEVGARKLS